MQEQPNPGHRDDESAQDPEEALYAMLGKTEEKENTCYRKARDYFSEWHNIVSALTCLFVAAYTVITVFILRASWDTEERSLRAYVYPITGDDEKAAGSFRVMLPPDENPEGWIGFENSGQTPAYDYKISMVTKILPIKLPDDFDFPLEENLQPCCSGTTF